MSDRLDFYYLQLVTEGDLDEAFDRVEQADRDLAADHGLVGILSGLVVSERSTPALSVDVAQGVAYDQTGQRIEISADTAKSVAVDSDDLTTTVANVGNEKWLSIFAKFDRDLTAPAPDGNGDVVYFERNEFFQLVVDQGSEAPVGTASRPALRSDAILLADVRRTQGVTTILDAEIYVDRRQNAFELSAGALEVREGTAEASDQAILEHLNDHVTGGSGAHEASAISYLGGPAWADGTTNPATDAEAQLDKVVSDLASTTTSSSGGRKVGVEGLVGASSTISAGTLYAALVALKTAAYIDVAARSAWLGGRTNPAATAQAALEKIIVDLGLTTTSDDGMERIGGQAVAGSPNSLTAGSARSQADQLLGFVNALETTVTGVQSDISDLEGDVSRIPSTYSANGDDGDASPAPFATFSSSSYTNGVTLDIPSAAIGDVINIRVMLLCNGDFQNVARVRLQYVTGFGGGSPSTQTNIDGAVMSVSPEATSSTWIQIPLQGSFTVDQAGAVRIFVVGKTFLDDLNVRCYSIIADLFPAEV